MDDETGWNTILVDGWGPLVRAAVCDRVEDALAHAPGVLAVAAGEPDDAPAEVVERVHDEIVAAIAVETGADLDHLGSQAAWATYDDVWGELQRRTESRVEGMELVAPTAASAVAALLRHLPRVAVEQAGAVLDGLEVRLVAAGGGAARLHVAGLFHWLATDEHASEELRAIAREVVATARSEA